MGIRSILTLGAGLLGATALTAADLKNSDCLDCHSDKTLTSTNAAGAVRSLFVDAALLAGSMLPLAPVAIRNTKSWRSKTAHPWRFRRTFAASATLRSGSIPNSICPPTGLRPSSPATTGWRHREFYRQRDLLLTVSAEGTPPEIFQRTVDALASRPRRPP
jgi:hypothetical protein